MKLEVYTTCLKQSVERTTSCILLLSNHSYVYKRHVLRARSFLTLVSLPPAVVCCYDGKLGFALIGKKSYQKHTYGKIWCDGQKATSPHPQMM